uniref:Uncharacterized protein n=1 Tax=viral metagenome TaxID=1070528 RepID=A0A6M3LNV5_9ZZZZ
MPVRLTPAQAALLQRRTRPAADEPPASKEPAKPGRAPRKPILADQPPEPTRLLSVTVTPPKVEGGDWTVKAEYNDGSMTMGCPAEARAKAWKKRIEEYHA